MKKPIPHTQIKHCGTGDVSGSALVIVLLFLLLLTGVSITFLLRARSSVRTESLQQGGDQAERIADVAVARLSAELANEASEGAKLAIPPALPVRYGAVSQNPRESKLVRRSVGTDSTVTTAYTGAGFSSGNITANVASTISTTSKPVSGPEFKQERWNAPLLLSSNMSFSGFTPPDWVYVGEKGPEKNPAKVIGRYAYMLYDLSGSFDINVAGFSSSDGDLADKGSTVFADMKDYFSAKGGDFSKFIAWRNGSGNATLSSYYGDPSVITPATAGVLESSKVDVPTGENRILSRQELVTAVDAGIGLSPELVANLCTESKIGNRINAEDLYANATTSSNAVKLTDSSLAASNDSKVMIYHLDGTQDTYTIKKGTPLFQQRFPLARLRWLADRKSDGTPKHPDEIKRHFGLTWEPADKVFIYTSPDGTGSVSSIKTLSELASQINAGGSAREPDFFEWLKSAINPDSLGQTGGTTNRSYPGKGNGSNYNPWEMSKDLHIWRIGLNIIDQADPDSIPTGIKLSLNDVSPEPFTTFGVENLPYPNEVFTAAFRSPATIDQLNGYLQFELWNPHQLDLNKKTPTDYSGNPLTSIKYGLNKGRVFMMPFIYMGATYTFYKDTSGSAAETWNYTWSLWDQMRAYSENEVLLTKPDSIFTNPDFSSSNATIAVDIPNQLSSWRDFYSEPYIMNSNLPGKDINNPFKTGMRNSYNDGETVYFGQMPGNNNAILLAGIDLPNTAFTGKRFSGTSVADTSGIYPYRTRTVKKDYPMPDGTTKTFSFSLRGNTGTDSRQTNYFWAPQTLSGAKGWNALAFYSYDGGTFKNVETKPIRIFGSVTSSAGEFPSAEYSEIAFGIMRQNNGEGILGISLAGLNMYLGGNQAHVGQNFVAEQVVFPATPPAAPPYLPVNSAPPHPSTSSASRMLAWEASTNQIYFSDWQRQPGIRKGYVMTDPRTERFGFGDQAESTPGQGIYPRVAAFTGDGMNASRASACLGKPGGTYPTTANGTNNIGQSPASQTPIKWTLFDPNISMSVPSDLAQNGASGNLHTYTDYDDKMRPADARWIPDSDHPALPGAKRSRPIFLDRPFRSVAELGVVFRDIPWKSIDLFSSDGPDRRLLDIFSVEDRSITNGKINPNSAPLDVLEALVRKVAATPVGDSRQSVPDDIVDKVAKYISDKNPQTAPIVSLEKLASELILNTPAKPDGSGYSTYKHEAESFLRSISSSLDTRYWHLMADIVTQSGKAISDDMSRFAVQGQRRYLVSFSVDRLTGQVDVTNLEVFNE